MNASCFRPTRIAALLLGLNLVAAAAPAATATPATDHPRLLFRSDDLPALRARMTDSNDVWVAFRDHVVTKALADWRRTRNADGDLVEPDGTLIPASVGAGNGWGAAPEDDTGAHTGGQPMFSEQYAMIFAFMALMTADDPAQSDQHAEYVTAAKECLFKVIEPASLGHPAPDANGKYPPFRHPSFALQDRSFMQEAFSFTVDWIHADLTPHELAMIRRTFLLWTADTWAKPYYSPINPNHLLNDPALLGLDTPEQSIKRSNLRLALNNHYANHLRQMVLYALAFDPADDVPSGFADVDDAAEPGALTGYTVGPGGPADWVYQNKGVLRDVTGSWLYLTDYALRHDGAGGLSVEGTQYASNGLGPLALTLAALQSAGEDDPVRFGPQVSLARNPFWSRVLPGYLALLTPTTRVNSDPNYTYLGPHFQPPLTGDLENYAMINDQFTKVLVPLALADWRAHGTTGEVVQAVRYIQRHLAPGGTARLSDRIRSTRSELRYRDAIYYFLLFDPTAPPPLDPRPLLQPATFWAGYDPAGTMGVVLARSGTSPQDTYFQTQLGWSRIDHQQGDSLGFGLWKNGLWLTKIMTGYGLLQGSSDYRNAPALQNVSPLPDPYGVNGNLQLRIDHGSQLAYESAGDPHLIARSFGETFLHFDGDATPLYNSYNHPEVGAVTHASRSLVWLKPDTVVVYDRSESQDGLWKRFYLNLPSVPTISGNLACATASEGPTPKAKLFVSSLLPLGATVSATDIASGQPSPGEDMKARLVVEATGAPAVARFLQVVQGTDPVALAPDATQLIQNTAGTAYDGAVVGSRAVLFKHNAYAVVDVLTYTVPAEVTEHYVTGLAPYAGYAVDLSVNAAGATLVTLAVDPTAPLHADGGGVLVLGGSELPQVEIKASALTVVEGAIAPITCTVSRSGDVSQPLTVALALDPSISQADPTDVSPLPTWVTFPAGAATFTFDLTATADGIAEGPEDLVIALQPGPGFHLSPAAAAVTISIGESAPASGQVQFGSPAYSAAENNATGLATITVNRVGGLEGPLSVNYATTGGTADAGADYAPTTGMLTWAPGDNAPKSFSIVLLDDPDAESTETVNLVLLSPSIPGALGSPATATLSILDDDANGGGGSSGGDSGGDEGGEGVLQFAVAQTDVQEESGAVTLLVTRTGGTAGSVSAGYYTLTYSASAGADYSYTSGTLHWGDGDGAAKIITVPLLDDPDTEGAEYFKVTLQKPTNGATLGEPFETTVTIAASDLPPPIYNVGAGQPDGSLADVDWSGLPPGATVRLHWQEQPYHSKILLSARGTAAQPIVFEGVPGPAGQRPVIDGTDAVAGSAQHYAPWFGDVIERSIIAVARSAGQPPAYRPGYVVIQGLELTMSATATLMPSYVKPDGSTASYYTSAGAIYLYGAEHVTIRDCEIHHAPNGIVAASGSSDAAQTCDVVVERCHLHHAGRGGMYHGNNIMAESLGLTVQFCRLDRGLNSSNAANLSDRSAGTVIRYNRIEGGSKLLDLIEPQSAAAAILTDPAFADTQVYGNLLFNGAGDYGTDGSNLLRYGGDYGNPATFRQGTLHFHHNTVLIDSQRWQTTLFDVSSPAATVLADNNILHHAKLAPWGGPFNLVNSGRAITLGRNWITSGYTLNGIATGGTGLVLSGAAPGFVSPATGDYHPGPASLLADTALPLAAGAWPVAASYFELASGVLRTTAGSAPDLGALEATATLDTWRAANFLDLATDPLIAGDAADPDGDGITNLAEFLAGTDPLSAGP